MDEKELHLSQYNQVWEQRRQHITLFWTIPVTAAIVSYIAETIDFSKLSLSTKFISLILTGFFMLGAVMMSLRHAFIRKAYGLLLQDMEDRIRNPLRPLPQSDVELRALYHHNPNLTFWERIGANWRGAWSWGIILTSAAFFILILWMDMSGLPAFRF